MAWFFTGDTHFFHKRVIEYSKRPFADIEEMHEAIISRWNALVTNRDSVVHVGDFSYSNAANALKVLRRLNGAIHMIRGNHDEVAHKLRDKFASFRDLAEFKVEGRCVIACHYPLRIWNKAHHGAIHVHGHSHGSLIVDPHSPCLDVGVDTHDFTPYTAEEVFAIADSRTFKPIDHHAPEELIDGCYTESDRCNDCGTYGPHFCQGVPGGFGDDSEAA